MQWTPEADDFIRQMTPLATDAEIAQLILDTFGQHVTKRAVTAHRQRLGISRQHRSGDATKRGEM